MECLLCEMWARMPYAKKWSTPTSVQETEGALIVGYWIASRSKAVPRICERHMAVLEILDRQEEQRIAAEEAAKQPVKRFTRPQQQAVQVQQPVLPVMPPIIPLIPPIPIQPAVVENFSLGMTPLRNENTITDQPPLPAALDLSAPYQAKPGTAEGALEAARMAPTEGGKVSYPCPSCGKEITTGDVHACEVVTEEE